MTDRELMQQTLEALIWTTGSDDFGDNGKAREGALKLLFPSITALRERLAQPEQEPFCFHDGRNIVGKEYADHSDVFPLYTAPSKREWVGLTDEEIYDYADKFLYQHGSNYGIRSFGKAIEAKLKEKNVPQP